MKITLQAGEALLIQGPTEFFINEGKGHIFFRDTKEHEIITVPVGVTYPFVATRKATLNFKENKTRLINSDIEDIYPKSWLEVFTSIKERIENQERKSFIFMTIGGTSSGKSGFLSCLAHQLLKLNHPIYLLDLDVGQNKLFIPGCLALSKLKMNGENPFPRGQIKRIYFIGSNSPRGLLFTLISAYWKFNKTWNDIVKLHQQQNETPILLIDTTGYVSGPEALTLKTSKVSIFRPDESILFPETIDIDNYQALLKHIGQEKVEHRLVTVPPGIKRQDPSNRKKTREQKYSELLAKMKPLSIPLYDITLFSYSMRIDHLQDVYNRLIALTDANGWTIGIGYLKTCNNIDGKLNALVIPVHDHVNLEKETRFIVSSYIRLNDDGTESIPMNTSNPSQQRSFTEMRQHTNQK